jgi:hypothetical protein
MQSVVLPSEPALGDLPPETAKSPLPPDVRFYGAPDTTSADGVSDNTGLKSCPNTDWPGRSGAKEIVRGFSL